MQGLILALTVALVLGIALVFVRLPKRSGELPYIRRVSLFSPAEVAFLHVLDRAVGSHYRIFAKTRIADVIDFQKSLPPRVHRVAFYRISGKHFDFVLCNPKDFSIAGVIELNDASHAQEGRAFRDAFVIDVCNAIGLPILMVRARHQYSAVELRSVIGQAFRG